jgi:hypothetical protein
VKFLHQTSFGFPNGNCFATCLACILELDVATVPNFCFENGDDWFNAANAWLTERFHLRMIMLKWDSRASAKYGLGDALCIAGGPAERGFAHAVVWKNGKLLHDPHPDSTGLIGDPEDYIVFLATDPSKGIGART